MGIIKGAISFGSNFNIGAAGPIDSRMRVATVGDLTTAWDGDAPAYAGMLVEVIDSGDLYVLNTTNDKTATDDAKNTLNWKKIGDVSGDISDLNAKVKANTDAIAANKTSIETEVSNRTSAVSQAKTDLVGSDTTVDTIKYAEAKAAAAQKTADDFIGRTAGFATSAQGALADTAVQTVTTSDTYLTVTRADGSNDVTISSKGIDDAIKTAADAVKVSVKNGGYVTGTVDAAGRVITLGSTTHAVSTATSTADGLATAADVKSYVDTTTASKAASAVDGIAAVSKSNLAGEDVVVTVSTAKGSVTSVSVDASVLKKAASDDATSKANAAKTNAINTVVGTASDTKASDTIKGAKLYADDVAKTAADGVTVTAGTVTGETLITASASGKAVTVGSSAALKTAVSKANSAVQTVVNATDDKYITVSKDAAGTGITVASKGIDAAIKTATDAVAVTAGVATDETLITASASGKAVTVGSSAALKTAVANANSALQSVSGGDAITVTDKSKIALKIDTTTAGNVTLTQGANGLKASVVIPAAKVDGVATDDKILTLGTDKLISADVTIGYDAANRMINLFGKDKKTAMSSIDASDFIKDGMLKASAVATVSGDPFTVTFSDKTTHAYTGLTNGHTYLFFKFTDGNPKGAAYTYEAIDAQALVDVYTAGNGLTLSGHEFSVNTGVIATKASVDTLKTSVDANTKAIGTAKTDSAAATGLYKVIDDKVAAEVTARNTAISTEIGKLDKDDTAVAKQLVSAVSEKDGVITVSRRALVADDIPTLAVSKIDGLQDAIDSKINALDVTGNVSAAVNGVTVTVNETDGKVAKPVVSIAAGSVASGNGNLVTGGAVYTAVEAAKTAASTALNTALTWGMI